MTSDNEQTVSFLPFHAINEFMTDEYRLEVLRDVLKYNQVGGDAHNGQLDRLTRQLVKVPGFRQSDKAPSALKLRPLAQAFEKNPELVASVLSSWTALHTDLRLQVYDLLLSRGWTVLPPDTDRGVLPGFLMVWPKNESFEQIDQAYRVMFPESIESFNNVALMTVWLSGRLPYHVEDDESAKPAE